LGTTMAGVGAFRLFSSATRHVMRVPETLEKGTEFLERAVHAVETQNALTDQVLELKALVMSAREEIQRVVTEREHIGRELRLMSRKIDAINCCTLVEE
jgi:hypothetical protein